MSVPVTNRRRGLRFGWRVFLRVAWAAAAASVAFAFVIVKRKEIFAKLIEPADGRLSPFESGLPIIIGIPDGFTAVLWLGMRAGLAVGIPILTVGMLHLFKPWFKPVLWWYTIAFLVVTTGCFVASAIFVYYVIIPNGVTWLLKFTGGIAEPVITLDAYVGLLTTLMLAMLVVFEFPPLMYMLAKARIVRYRHFKRARWTIWGAAFIFSALITPGFDPMTATLVLIPFLTLYEFGMLLAWLARPEEGNYLWIKTIGRWVGRVRYAVGWTKRRPAAVWSWIERKSRR